MLLKTVGKCLTYPVTGQSFERKPFYIGNWLERIKPFNSVLTRKGGKTLLESVGLKEYKNKGGKSRVKEKFKKERH